MISNSWMKAPFVFIWWVVLGHSATAQHSVLGSWKTIDDESRKPKFIVEIYEQNGLVFGRIVRLFPEPGEDSDPICDKCIDYRKDQKISGMTILNSMEKDGDQWAGGQIMDPENGKTYRCRIWLEDGTLKVRGYVAFFLRTQTWIQGQFL